ncbi:MAG: conjugal transfer protein TraR [Ignavibacteria bacterium]|jgi:RNA polymerase-binding transcription factor DksA|nr:conjugal transfer protein TraR [Ignavibacteria bacterium]
MATKSDPKKLKNTAADKPKASKTAAKSSSTGKSNGTTTTARTASAAAKKAGKATVREKEQPKKKAVQTKVKDVMKKEKKKDTAKEKDTLKANKLAVKEGQITVNEPVPANQDNDSTEIMVTSPKKNVRKIKGYGKEDLEYFKKIILDKRDEIIEQLQNLREQMMDPTTGQYVNENSPYSLHMAEQGTDAMEREKIFLWAQRENKFLGYLDDALHRIENGTYGICIECIDEPQNLCPTCPLISKERLAAVPHSQLCLPVKQRQEKK